MVDNQDGGIRVNKGISLHKISVIATSVAKNWQKLRKLNYKKSYWVLHAENEQAKLALHINYRRGCGKKPIKKNWIRRYMIL